MSKAFVKDDVDEAPLVVQPVPLAPESENYITRAGYQALEIELKRLTEKPTEKLTTSEAEARAVILRRQLETAQVLDFSGQKAERVLFGACVTVRTEEESTKQYQIVGIDEADVKAGRISYISPIAKALLQKQIGDVVQVQTPSGPTDLEILQIEWICL